MNYPARELHENPDILRRKVLDMDYEQILSLCLHKDIVVSTLCEDQRFWIEKLNYDRQELTWEELFIQSVDENRLYYVALLLNPPTNLIKAVDATYNQNQAILIACMKGYVSMVELLLRYVGKNACINCEDRYFFSGSYPIIVASQYGHVKVVQLLLEKGEDIGRKNSQRLTAIEIASKYGHIDVVKFLLKNGLNAFAYINDSLITASINGYDKIVKVLIDAGASPATQNNYSIQIAASKNYLEVVKILLNNDEVVKENGYILTFKSAIITESINVIKFLLHSNKFDPTNIYSDIINVIIDKNHDKVLRIILKDKRFKFIKDDYVSLALEKTIFRNPNIKIIRLLLQDERTKISDWKNIKDLASKTDDNHIVNLIEGFSTGQINREDVRKQSIRDEILDYWGLEDKPRVSLSSLQGKNKLTINIEIFRIFNENEFLQIIISKDEVLIKLNKGKTLEDFISWYRLNIRAYLDIKNNSISVIFQSKPHSSVSIVNIQSG